MASWIATWSLRSILSNSSIQHTPLSASIRAPASMTNSNDSSSFTTAAVKPAAEEAFPEVAHFGPQLEIITLLDSTGRISANETLSLLNVTSQKRHLVEALPVTYIYNMAISNALLIIFGVSVYILPYYMTDNVYKSESNDQRPIIYVFSSVPRYNWATAFGGCHISLPSSDAHFDIDDYKPNRSRSEYASFKVIYCQQNMDLHIFAYGGKEDQFATTMPSDVLKAKKKTERMLMIQAFITAFYLSVYELTSLVLRVAPELFSTLSNDGKLAFTYFRLAQIPCHVFLVYFIFTPVTRKIYLDFIRERVLCMKPATKKTVKVSTTTALSTKARSAELRNIRDYDECSNNIALVSRLNSLNHLSSHNHIDCTWNRSTWKLGLSLLNSDLLEIDEMNSQSYNDVICRRPWYFNSPRPAPLRCPTPSFFTYYECCGEFLENCCWRFRQEPIIISIILLVLLFLLCCCCCIAWLAFGRKKKSTSVEPEKQLTTTKKDSQIQTISSSTIDSGTQWELRKGYEETERRRSYAAARDRELDYQYFS
ncbi:hypothetical protein GCK72_009518 [Caenorhabditis remanei]|uniref:Uncharacterized protein n=1 Tax=Caenorhabditis remanei TaxID=31234 RepID=A0A6A5H3A0_CAERE|nr:hypothetical protein GCK72_009518 [Caenorhabditis remanei]KAF1761264.1 hypothetical protein GCK72_009518 [Caenorhabditis remanei]